MPKEDLKMDFLFKAIDEVQQTNRFLDAKAGFLSGFESALLVVVISTILDKNKIQLLFDLYNNQRWYFIFLVGYIVLYVISLVMHIFLTLQVIFPSENPGSHIELGDFKSRNIFFIHKLGKNGKIFPPLSLYSEELTKMSQEDIKNEFIFEFLKLSYIRTLKSDRLKFSLRFLYILITGIVILGLLFVFGEYLLY